VPRPQLTEQSDRGPFPSPLKDVYTGDIRKNRLDNVLFLPLPSKSRLPLLLAAANISLMCSGDRLLTWWCHPIWPTALEPAGPSSPPSRCKDSPVTTEFQAGVSCHPKMRSSSPWQSWNWPRAPVSGAHWQLAAGKMPRIFDARSSSWGNMKSYYPDWLISNCANTSVTAK